MNVNWERFLHGEDSAGDIDPLVRMAVAHYQFEAIHPFSDGNGRTGRVFEQPYCRITNAVEPFRSAPQGRGPQKNQRSFQPRGFFK